MHMNQTIMKSKTVTQGEMSRLVNVGVLCVETKEEANTAI